MARVLTDDELDYYSSVSEAQRVEAWRLHVLVEAGYPVPLAEKLAAAGHVDLHRACQVIEQGCSHELAAEFLL